MALCAEICLFALRPSPWPSPALICITTFRYVKLVEGTSERSDCRRKGENLLFLSWLMSQAEAVLPSQFQFFLKIPSSRVPASIRQAPMAPFPPVATLCGFCNTVASPFVSSALSDSRLSLFWWILPSLLDSSSPLLFVKPVTLLNSFYLKYLA